MTSPPNDSNNSAIERLKPYLPTFLHLREEMGLGDMVGFGHLSSPFHRGSGALLTGVREGPVFDRGDHRYVALDPSRGDALLVMPDTKNPSACAISLDDAGISFLNLPNSVVYAAIVHELSSLKYDVRPEAFLRISTIVGTALKFGAQIRHPGISRESIADAVSASYVGYEPMLQLLSTMIAATPLAHPDKKAEHRAYKILAHRYSALERLQKRGFDARG